MSNLLPEETVDHVQKILGLSKYRSLNKLERLAVESYYSEIMQKSLSFSCRNSFFAQAARNDCS